MAAGSIRERSPRDAQTSGGTASTSLEGTGMNEPTVHRDREAR